MTPSRAGAVAFPLERLTSEIRLAALDLGETEPALAAARLMDGLRDAGLPVPPLPTWAEAARELDRDAWQRVEVLTHLLRERELGPLVARALARDPARAWRVVPGFATREARLLTVELLVKSPFRVEELARKWVHALGGTIEGESPDESRRRMERLDFGGVLKSLEDAGRDREERMRKLQEIEAKRLKEQQEAYARQSRE